MGWQVILYGRIYVDFSFLVVHKVCTKARLLGERSVRIREVKGSNPSRSTILCKSELNLLCEALFRICFCFRGCGSVHILFFRRIVSKRLFRILDASRGRVAPANPRAVYMRPLRRSKKQKAAYLRRDKRLLAGVEGFEPSARGFGDRCSTN